MKISRDRKCLKVQKRKHGAQNKNRWKIHLQSSLADQTEERIDELEHVIGTNSVRSTKENRMNKAKGTSGTPSRRLISTLSPREIRERTRKLIKKKNNGQKLPKSGVGNGHPDPRSPRKQKMNSKKSTLRHIIIKFSN